MSDEAGAEDRDADETGSNGAEGGEKEEEEPGESQASVVLTGVLFWGVLGGVFLYNYYGIGDPVLQVVASANLAPGGDTADDMSPSETAGDETAGEGAPARTCSETPEDWVVRGHVLYDGRFITGADVWAIGQDGRGNRYATNPRKTDAGGAFILEALPGVRCAEPLTSVEVFSRANPAEEAPADGGPDASNSAGSDANGETRYVGWRDASAFLSLGGFRRHRVVDLPTFQIGLLAGLFFVSIVIALVPLPQGSEPASKNYWLIGKYITSVVLAAIFTTLMIGYISAAMRTVNVSLSRQQNEVLLLGFGNIYRGRYVSEAEPEWLFSLTAPHLAPAPDTSEPAGTEAETEPPEAGGEAVAVPSDPLLTKGFGAPLWVMFVAVVGSALFTISIIVQTIKDRIPDLAAAELRKRIQSIVLHQFYILFAPLGAIFVFQLMVMLGMAKHEVTVAITILAAGIALNFLLDAARRRMTALIEKAQAQTG